MSLHPEIDSRHRCSRNRIRRQTRTASCDGWPSCGPSYLTISAIIIPPGMNHLQAFKLPRLCCMSAKSTAKFWFVVFRMRGRLFYFIESKAHFLILPLNFFECVFSSYGRFTRTITSEGPRSRISTNAVPSRNLTGNRCPTGWDPPKPGVATCSVLATTSNCAPA